MYVGYFLSRLRFLTDVSLRNYFTLAASVNLIVMGYADNFEVVPGAEMARLIDRRGMHCETYHLC